MALEVANIARIPEDLLAVGALDPTNDRAVLAHHLLHIGRHQEPIFLGLA
jgi:hypothetical protein